MHKQELPDPVQIDPLKSVLKTNLQGANDYLHKVSASLARQTNPLALQKEMGTFWQRVEPFLKTATFSSKMDPNDPLLKAIQSFIDEPNLDQTLAKLSKDQPESKNFLDNLGQYFFYIAPFYNDLLTRHKAIISMHKSPPSPLKEISLNFCNIFIKASGISPASAWAAPGDFPIFTKHIPYVPPQPPIPPSAPIPQPTPLAPPSKPAEKKTTPPVPKPTSKTSAKENRIIAAIKKPFIWIGSIIGRFWNWLVGKKN